MRIIRFLIYYAIVTALGVIALLFLGLNHFTVQLDLIEAQYSVSVAWVIVGAVVFGFVLALLVLLPGRIAAGLYARSLARDIRALNDDVRDLEYDLDEQEDLRARLLEQYELLLERHERMVVRHQTLVSDHSQVVAERDDIRAQLAALRIARPARPATSVSHGSAVATALRLVPPMQASSGVPSAPVARPTTPQPAPAPVARMAPPAAPAMPAPAEAARTEPASAPTEAHPVTPITPGPWPGVAHVAPAAPIASEPAEPEPATVPVVSSAPAPTTPTTTPVPVAAPALVELRAKGAGIWARLQASAHQFQQASAEWLAHTRQRLQQRGGSAWRAFSMTVSTQSKALDVRVQALQQRLRAMRREAE